MNRQSVTEPIMSRVPADGFIGREAELNRIGALDRLHRNALVLGAPRVGKSELLQQAYDRAFLSYSSVIPILIRASRDRLSPHPFANEFLSQLVAQVSAFRRRDSGIVAWSDRPLTQLWQVASAEDHSWVRALIDATQSVMQLGDPNLVARSVFSAVSLAARETHQKLLVMVDDAHLLADDAAAAVRSELEQALSRDTAKQAGSVYVVSGLRRPLLRMMSANEALFEGIELVTVDALNENELEKLIAFAGASLKIEISDSTAELMIQQLDRDLFYLRALLTAASSRGGSLRTFMEFERLYTEEVVSGRIANYLEAVIREVGIKPSLQRAALEAITQVVEAESPLARDLVIDRISRFTSEPDELLIKLHDRELLNLSVGFVERTNDPVLADFVVAKYRKEVGGEGQPRSGSTLLREKLVQSYQLMMSRYFRSIESELIELLSRFDFQSVPASLFDHRCFEDRYCGIGRPVVSRLIHDEETRTRLPQVVVVSDLDPGELATAETRLLAASGFEGGIYSQANEVLWQIALINSREPLDDLDIKLIEDRLERTNNRSMPDPGVAQGASPRQIRWYISKEGFTESALDRIAGFGSYCSNFLQLDLLYNYVGCSDALIRSRAGVTEFELVIPIENESELIAARTAEQVARAAGFDQQAINQIKTALVEACLNAAEHSNSPDRRIHHTFAVSPDRLSITVSNKGTPFIPPENGVPAGPSSKARGRGLQIIRALMDEARFEKTDDGARLVIVKYLRRIENRQ